MPNETPRFVTCRCQHCDNGIEFDASGFNEMENCSLICPHCQTETAVTIPPRPPPIPPTLEEIERGKLAASEQITIEKILQIKALLRNRLASGKSAFFFDSLYVPVDSQLLDGEFANEFDVSTLRRLGLLGWDVVQAVPRTKGVGLENIGTDTLFGSKWAGGVGGNVMGVHVIIKKQISASDLITDDPDDEVGNFIRTHLEDFSD
jgi:hypothetical protein